MTVISDDETEKMPPPAMPAPKARGRPRTRKAKLDSTALDGTRVKVERPSVATSESVSDLSQQKSVKSRSKKVSWFYVYFLKIAIKNF